MNTPVNFEIATSLKEKGFDKPTSKYFRYDGKECENKPLNWNEDVGFFSRPSIAEVVMWLYEKHGIWILVDWMSRIKPFNSGFYSHLRGTTKPLNQDNFISINNTKMPGYEVFNSPTEAYEAAIEYTLKNLI